MSKYTSLFLDLDNTLLDFNKAEEVAIKRTLMKHNLPCDENAVRLYSDINRQFWEKFERGEIEKSEIYEGRFKALLKEFGSDCDSKAVSDDYIVHLSEGYFKIEGTDELLTYLKEKGYMLYATTNGNCFTQYKRVKNSGLEKYFLEVFVSEKAGFQKPDCGYFQYVIDNIPEKDKSKMLIVGDSQSSDILGGINIGIDTCWYNPTGATPKYKSKYEINNIMELKNIL